MGLAAAWKLAEAGASVTVLERHEGAHQFGSHGGYTRVIRQAYHEGSGYVPLVQEADAQWCGLERTPGELLVRSGMLEFGTPDDEGLQAAISACRDHGLEHELLTAGRVEARYPFRIPSSWIGCFTPSGGYLKIAECFAAMRARAEAAGASFRARTEVAQIRLRPLRVHLRSGETLTPDRLVLAAGAGTPELLPEGPSVELRRLRRVMFWLRTPPATTVPWPQLPVWGAFVPEGFFYGFPLGDHGVSGLKIACHTSVAIPGLDDPIEPTTLDRTLSAGDWDPVQRFLTAHLPAAGSHRIAHRVCMYTATPSWDFLVDRHPDDAAVVVAAGFSGHGFKLAPAVGRLVAELVSDDASPHPGFAWGRHRA